MTPLKGSHPVRWTTVFQPPFKNGHSCQMYKSIWKVDISVSCTILFDRHPQICMVDTPVMFTPLPGANIVYLYARNPLKVDTPVRCITQYNRQRRKVDISVRHTPLWRTPLQDLFVWQTPLPGAHLCMVDIPCKVDTSNSYRHLYDRDPCKVDTPARFTTLEGGHLCHAHTSLWWTSLQGLFVWQTPLPGAHLCMINIPCKLDTSFRYRHLYDRDPCKVDTPARFTPLHGRHS